MKWELISKMINMVDNTMSHQRQIINPKCGLWTAYYTMVINLFAHNPDCLFMIIGCVPYLIRFNATVVYWETTHLTLQVKASSLMWIAYTEFLS
jgi:hypothetical protein